MKKFLYVQFQKLQRWTIKNPILSDIIDMFVFFAISVGSLFSQKYIGSAIFFLLFTFRLVDLIEEIKNKN